MSTCTRKVLTTLAELGAPYDFVTVDLGKGEHKAEPHLSHQPFGQVPALVEDDGFEMYESRAICRYINETNHGKLLPSDAKSRAKVEQWMSVETSNFTPHVMKFIYEYVFKRPQGEAVIKAATESLEKALGIMEAQLSKTPFIAGSEFTLADIGFMPYIEYAMNSPAKDIFAKYPSFMKWWSTVSTRPSWQKVSGKAAA